MTQQQKINKLREELKKKLPEKPYIIIKIDYTNRYILPCDEAMQFLDLLSKVEIIDNTRDPCYDDILPLNTSKNFEIIFVSHEEYLDKKMSAILGISINNGVA